MRTRKNIALGMLMLVTLASKDVAVAQTADTALAYVRYSFTHIYNTRQPDKPKKEEMILYLGKGSSKYLSYSMKEATEKAEKKLSSEVPKGEASKRYSSSSAFSVEQLFLYPEKKQLINTCQIAMSQYKVPLDYPEIDWKVGNDTRQIGGYSCQQATGTFGGRIYTAWFTTELPFPCGPWKLHGLPGLILEAEDSKKEVKFAYAGFDKQTQGEDMSIPKEAVVTTAKELAKAKEAFNDDPLAAMLRNIPADMAGNAKIMLKDESGKEITMDDYKQKLAEARRGMAKSEENNPLELNEP